MGLIKNSKKSEGKLRTKLDKSKATFKAGDSTQPQKTKLHKVECRLVPIVTKLSIEEMAQNGVLKKFHNCVNRIFSSSELIMDSDVGYETKAKLSKKHLADLCLETAKLKTLRAMDSIPPETITRLLCVLEKIISDSEDVSLFTDPNNSEQEDKKVTRAVDASLTVLNILTSHGMHKTVYLADVIDAVVMFTKHQLLNSIFPFYNPNHNRNKSKNEKAGKSCHGKRRVSALCDKLKEVVSMLAQLLSIQPLTDTTLLPLSSVAVSPLFVEGIDQLQQAALKLVTGIFAKYKEHRRLILDDIILSMARLRGSRRHQLQSQEQIHITTVLILRLVQCLVVLPQKFAVDEQVDIDSVISTQLTSAHRTALIFLDGLLGKCSAKSEDTDYRLVFENLILDLLTAYSQPEWSAAELILSVLANLLLARLADKNQGVPLRMISLDLLGTLVTRMYKDAVEYKCKSKIVDEIINNLKLKDDKDQNHNIKEDEADSEWKTQEVQRVLLDYLAVMEQDVPTLYHSRHLYLALWYQDSTATCDDSHSKSSLSEPVNASKRVKSVSSREDSVELSKVIKKKQKFLQDKIVPFEHSITKEDIKREVQSCIDHSSAELLLKYVASNRPFSKSVPILMKHILRVLADSSVLLRTKAVRCFSAVVAVDPEVLALQLVHTFISNSLLDHCASVREAAVDLVSKFVLSHLSLVDKYYDTLSARILDTGAIVRKKVIKIMKDICIKYPDFSKIVDIYVKIIRRLNDEEDVRRLVVEVLQCLWFSAGSEEAVVHRAANITGVIASSEDQALEGLLVHLFKPNGDKDKEISAELLTACKQIVDHLVAQDLSVDGSSIQRVVVCLRTLFIFTKVQPQLFFEHISKLQPYLRLKAQGEHQITSWVVRILGVVVPLMDTPSPALLSQLEQDMVDLMVEQDQAVILSCVTCLGSVVNNLTRNYELIRNCLDRYSGCLLHFKTLFLDSKIEEVERKHPIIKRSLYIVGLILRFFDFSEKEVLGPFPESTRNVVVDILMFYLQFKELQCFTLKAIGSVCVRHCALMFAPNLKTVYLNILRDSAASIDLKIQVLNNLEQYLQEEESRMIQQDKEWEKLSKQENLKEMADVSSGMASTVVQLFAKEVLEGYFHPNKNVRQAVFSVVHLILQQGLVHPAQLLPYLVCMSTDEECTVRDTATRRLKDIKTKCPGLVLTQAQKGLHFSHRLQQVLAAQDSLSVVRGFRNKEEGHPDALNGTVYSVLGSKQQRHAFVISIMRLFDQPKVDLSELLFLADNMAYFPYQTKEEILFIIYQIDIIISVTGTNLLQSFLEALLPKATPVAVIQPTDCVTEEPVPNEDEDEEEEEEGVEELLDRVPEDTVSLQESLAASRSCMLLLLLKQHLKSLYNIHDNKISEYSPSESGKVYERAAPKKKHSVFNPKIILENIKPLAPQEKLDKAAQRSMISEFLEFKYLLMKLDLKEEENDENYPIQKVEVNLNKPTRSRVRDHNNDNTPRTVSKRKQRKIDSKSSNKKDHNSKYEKKPRLNKKRCQKRKKTCLGSDDDCSDDPDFLP